jgi:excisionase family DNA binding protein
MTSMPAEKSEARNQARRPFRLAEVEELTGLSSSTLRRAIRFKELACFRFGRAIRISEDDLEAYLRRHRKGNR